MEASNGGLSAGDRVDAPPPTVSGDLANLPEALTPLVALPHWVVWRWRRNAQGKWSKPPFQAAKPRAHARNNDAATWGTYAAALAVVAAGKAEGVGFCLLGSGIVAFDIDNCRDPTTGSLHPWAEALVERVGSYTEITPSGTGVRIIGTARGPEIHRKQAVADGVSIEAYRDTARYITISGNPLPGAPPHLADIDAHIDAVVAELDAAKATNGAGETYAASAGITHPTRGGDAPADDSPDVDTIVKTGDASRWGGDRSRAVWFAACELLRRRMSQDEVVAVLVDASNGISEHVRQQSRPTEYAKRQVAKAAAEVKREAVDNRPPVVGVTIVRGTGDEPALWTLQFIDGEALTLTSDEVDDQKRFLRRCFGRFGRRYLRRSEAAYNSWVNELAAGATVREPAASTTQEEEFQEQVEEFLTNRMKGDQREDILSGRPWHDEQSGRHLFRLRDLEHFLDTHRSRFRTDSRRRIGERLRDLGGDSFSTSIKGQTEHLWWIPADAVRDLPEDLPPPPRKASPL